MAELVLAVDGNASDGCLPQGEPVGVELQAGVRALTVRTSDDVALQLEQLLVDPELGERGVRTCLEPGRL